MAWMIKHFQLVVANKGVALMANYRLEEENDQTVSLACAPASLLGG